MNRNPVRAKRRANLWHKVMAEGQLTRDPCLRTQVEIEADRRIADKLARHRSMLMEQQRNG